MGVVSARTFERWLRRLDAERFRAFVSDLYAASGRDVRRRADGTLAFGDTGRVVVTVASRRRLRTPRVPDHADVVVAASPSRRLAGRAAASRVTLVGPSDLREMALYGVDRGDCERLVRRYFDESPFVSRSDADANAGGRTDADGDANAGAGEGAGANGRRVFARVAEKPRSSLLALVLAGVVVAAALLGPVGPGLAPAGDSTGGPNTEPTGGGASSRAADSAVGRFPPGVGPTGVVSAETLAAAHADAVAGRSYQLLVRQSGTDVWAGWNHAHQRAEVANQTNYRYSVTGYRSTGEENGELVQYSMYADGTHNYVFAGDGENRSFVRYAVGTDEDGHGPFENRAASAVERYLDATRTNVTRDDRSVRPYRIVATGTPESVDDPENVTDYRAEAHVGADGFVSLLTVAYEIRTDDGVETVSFRMEYVNMDVQTVRTPWWYDEARNATGGTDRTPVTTARANETTRPSATPQTASALPTHRVDPLADVRFRRLAPP